ncbi:aminotransferase class I/II-fold pyridoxal phosphate-dependent enzyme [Schlesneria paludicola]|uniref:aminotransferase class I/II-fold pyridoxal phosphate-dependent enzyme n=1 Tax=Schlesneria paludicola TaxID=360056 RepID=UPI00029B207F|nr:aminotransferase class I/II-fold pyridoxal phosphate-dependent enzyme [Schlesneria paludicola]
MNDQTHRVHDEKSPSLKGSLISYLALNGKTNEKRLSDWTEWLASRRNDKLWPYSRVIEGHPGVSATVCTEKREHPRRLLNFGSQDYLSLSKHPQVIEAAVDTCRELGVHSAGSPILAGRTAPMYELENRISQLCKKECCAIFSTGWAAGFGVMAGLVRSDDSVVIDRLAHNCLCEGTKHATDSMFLFAHNSTAELTHALQKARRANDSGGVFVVVESLYSMDSDSPDLQAVVSIARQFDAITILDVAHDFGCMGASGLGLLDVTPEEFWPDVIMGSFSKTFASNGGFVAASEQVIDYLRCYSSPFAFSNALSPVQASIVLTCLDLVFSETGSEMRQRLAANVDALRRGMTHHGFHVAGKPSPIVPVFVGSEANARVVSRELGELGLMANLVEFPGVPRGSARFRFQVMRDHTMFEIDAACEVMRKAADTAGLLMDHW